MEASVAMPEEVESALGDFLLRDTDDEEIAFAVWYPSRGIHRFSILIRHPIFPLDGDRERHGNVSALPEFVDRAKETARRMRGGLAMIHTHPKARGWQWASGPDVYYERDVMAREVFGITGLPLVGLTLSEDRAWSARYYPKEINQAPILEWCSSVRVVGKMLRMHFNPRLKPEPSVVEEQIRTTSVWGDRRQADLMRLRVGIIGAGSVGSGVAEIIARIGAGELYVMDYDVLKPHNLDRSLGASHADAENKKSKAILVAENAKNAATYPGFRSIALDGISIVEDEGYRSALDCDVIFSCVDRPWPRQVLNHLAYSCLIPVVDGGVSFKIDPNGKLIHGMFRAQTIGPSRACMKCLGVYDEGEIQLDREGKFDDPSYIEHLKPNEQPSRQNIMPFAMGLAGLETIQFAELVTGLAGKGDLGQQPYDYRAGELLPIHKSCFDGCEYPHLVGLGESEMPFLSTDLSKERTIAERTLAGSNASKPTLGRDYTLGVRLTTERIPHHSGGE